MESAEGEGGGIEREEPEEGVNSLTAIDGHERQLFIELLW